jgi:hypothetical protein
LRDLRKFFNEHFTLTSDFVILKNHSKDSVLVLVLKSYVQDNFSSGLLAALGVSLNELTFFMGSLMYPKEMLKIYMDDPA